MAATLVRGREEVRVMDVWNGRETAMPPLPGALLTRLSQLSLEEPRHAISAQQVFGPEHRSRRAAVMIPLCQLPSKEPGVLLTRRALHMNKHAGEYSFPGGQVDAGDAGPLEAALRECEEEVALPASAVSVFGYFASVPTLTNYQIEAFIGQFDAATPLIPAADEVHSIALTPLADLCRPGVHRVRIETHRGLEIPIHAFDLDPEQPIWGATAYLLHEMLQFLGLKYQ